MVRNILPVLFIAFLFGCSNAQPQLITRDEYYKPWRDARSKSETLSRRGHQKITSAYGGKLRKEEWTYEYQPPDRTRVLHIETINGITKRTEEIKIADTKFCKKDEADWVRASSYCIGGSGVGGPSNVTKITYYRTVRKIDGKVLTEYETRIEYLDKYSKTAETDGPTYWESAFLIDPDGLIVSESTRQGLVKDGKPYSETVQTYEYSDIKIEAPIK